MSRAKNPLPGHYYEEYLYKKDANDKVYKRLWVGLQGNTLCFYSNHKDLRRVDCLSLETFVSVKDNPFHSPSGYIFSLCLTDREVQFKTESLESREMWKAYILTVVELRIPQFLTLLPGPLLALKEALVKEKHRQSQLEEEMDQNPSCFYNVSRMEAETLLKKHPECGSLLLRPGTNQENLSVSTCQPCQGNFVVRHYKVIRQQEKYVIQVEPPVTCPSLAHVVNHFVRTTQNRLSPFEKCNEYENKIGIHEVNNENGEVTVTYPVNTPATTPTPWKGPPPLPRDPPPQDMYEIPDDEPLSPMRFKPESPPWRVREPVPLPVHTLPATRPRGVEVLRNPALAINPGLDEELRDKLEQIRRKVELSSHIGGKY